MGTRAGGRRTGPKCIAIVGPFASGKTTLLEAILARTGSIPRQNLVSSGATVSDHSPEARAHAMSVEATIATTEFMGEQITFVDCPGSIEFSFEAEPVLAAWPEVSCSRGRRKEDPCSAAHYAQARRSRRAAHPVPQQGRQGNRRCARHAEDAAAGKLRAAPAAPDSAAQGRRRHRLDRSGAGARLHLPRICRERGGSDTG